MKLVSVSFKLSIQFKIFEKSEEMMEIDDAMTYAPEIQSIEIQPDEASVNSENLLEYFDQVAAEYTDVISVFSLHFILAIFKIP